MHIKNVYFGVLPLKNQNSEFSEKTPKIKTVVGINDDFCVVCKNIAKVRVLKNSFDTLVGFRRCLHAEIRKFGWTQ